MRRRPTGALRDYRCSIDNSFAGGGGAIRYAEAILPLVSGEQVKLELSLTYQTEGYR